MPEVTSDPSTLPMNSMNAEPAARCVSVAEAAMTSGVPRDASVPFERSPTRGAIDPEDRRGERCAHERELDQMLGANLGVGADVQQRAGVSRNRQRNRERWAMHAPPTLDVEQAGCKGGPGRAAADQCVSVARRDSLGRLHDRGLGRAANGTDGVGGLCNRHRRVDDLHAVDRLA